MAWNRIEKVLGISALAALMLGAISASAQVPQSKDGLWQLLDKVPLERAAEQPWVRPEVFQGCLLSPDALQALMKAIPMESAVARVSDSPAEITIPQPDGKWARFKIVESPIMEPALAAQFPEIHTYLGQGIDDPYAAARLDWTPAGFHAQVLTPNGDYYIDPYSKGDTSFYASYYKRDYHPADSGFVCGVEGSLVDSGSKGYFAPPSLMSTGPTRRNYRLACAATGEYTAFHGGTAAAGQAAIVTAINRVTGVYETEVCIRLTLVANNINVVYTNPATDPYTNSSGSTMLGQNQTALDSVIGSANYDIGHVFSTGGGGIAYTPSVCNAAVKAGGVTGLPTPIGDPFYIDYVCHEMGHQFSANHSFNGVASNCAARNGSTAMEPGSGSTIMAYAGICSTDNLQLNSDPYFHSISYDEIISYTTAGGGTSCGTTAATGNNPPVVSAGVDYTIPKGTPFTLTASGSDPNLDPITYCWEERDLGPAQSYNYSDNGSSPLFRSFNPVSVPTRTFPKMSDILSNTVTKGEQLPTTGRFLNFRVTVRDNRAGGGGVNFDSAQLTVSGTSGPFFVIFPNYAGLPTQRAGITVWWAVAGTNVAPVNTPTINIRLSTDGGNTFPTMLAAATPNDGSEFVTLPNINTSTARIKIEAIGNIYFNISQNNFSIGTYVNNASDWDLYL
ncbi:hypothetical protein HYR69_06685 [Candidatus Sumerlaeota bacterium]|nr:hypothetical protein [Candidatus Sumerlaeota bacterium]